MTRKSIIELSEEEIHKLIKMLVKDIDNYNTLKVHPYNPDGSKNFTHIEIEGTKKEVNRVFILIAYL